MPIYDWECNLCGARVSDHYSPLTTSPPPACPNEDPSGLHQMEKLWSRPSIDSISPFDYEGQTITSLNQARAIERESEKQARNGEGQMIAFRHLSQSKSNMGSNCFGPTPEQRFRGRGRGRIHIRRLGAQPNE